MTSDELSALAELEMEMSLYFWDRGHENLAEQCLFRSKFLRAKADEARAALGEK